MIYEAALITLSCVLFVQMGLADAVRNTLKIQSRIISCPKCLTFWSCIVYFIVRGNPIVTSVAASFISAFVSLWLSLAFDVIAAIYNSIYEQNNATPASAKSANPGEKKRLVPGKKPDNVPMPQVRGKRSKAN